MKNKNNGFTLVELLAVIVILGILLLLAMPAITKQIELARKKAFSNDAQTIAGAVKDDVLMGDKVLTNDNGFSYNMSDINNLLDKKLGKSPFGGNYKTASAKVDITKDSYGKRNYTIRVCLIDENGNGFGYNRVENISSDTIVMGNEDSGENKCETFGINTGPAVIIKDIVNSDDEEIKEQVTPNNETDESDGYRFSGSNSIVRNNYVYFNCSDTNNQTSSTCDLYRILGTSFVDDGNGNLEERVKLISVKEVNAPAPNTGKWNSTQSNDWTKSSLKTYLNTTFYDSINEKYRQLIQPAKYYLGGYENAGITRAQMYEYERKTANDDETYFYYEHEDTTYWVGNIALMYASDYGYATKDSSCEGIKLSNYNTDSSVGNGCGNNWIWKIDYQPSPSWLLNQVSNRSNDVYFTDNTGVSKSISVSESNHPAHPVFYLTATAELYPDPNSSDEIGTYNHPFRLFK